MSQILLGLIGDNIAKSRSPDLHRHCGQLLGLDVRYDLFIPPRTGQSFDEVFDEVRNAGLQGVNVTLPYKEKVVSRVQINDPVIARIAAVNTVRFGADGAAGFNTDYTGFMAAYRAAFDQREPGQVMLIGAGGVGKAIGFGLVTLAAENVIVVDKNPATAAALALSLAAAGAGRTKARVGDISEIGLADGVINCTPLGMHGYPGSPVPEGAFPNNGWAFDAVYTPMDTPFRAQAEAAGAEFLSGYELFFHQGVQAFEIFTGFRVENLDALRLMLDAKLEADVA